KRHDLEETPGALHILKDLSFQGLGGRPMDFAAEAREKFEMKRGFIGEINGLEVEDVSLYTKAHAFERGAVADVGHGLKVPVADGEAGDVDTESGKQAFIRREVDGRHKELCSDAAAFGGMRMHAEDASQHPAGAARVSGGDETAHNGARYFHAVHADGWMHGDREFMFFAEGAQLIDPSARAMT